MTPEEKAKELYVKFYELVLEEEVAKEIATIAVDEIIKHTKQFEELLDLSGQKYWYLVKEEIQKL